MTAKPAHAGARPASPHVGRATPSSSRARSASPGGHHRSGPRPYHHGDLRAALLDEVGRIIRRQGVAAVSLREVARRARVSHGAPAHHFANKAALLTAFAAEGYARLAQTIRDEVAASAARDGRARLAAVGRGYVRFALENPEPFGMMFRVDALDVHDAAFHVAGEAAYGELTAAVAACATEGRLGGRSPELVGVAAWSLVHGFASLWNDGRLTDRVRERDPRRIAAALAEMFVASLVTRRA